MDRPWEHRGEHLGDRLGGEPLVSVVIPSYNRAHVVAETLESVLAQTYRSLEIILVDDGSKDDTAGAVAPFRARGVTYVRTANQGLATARNTGMLMARGEYIAWLDSDDLWNPEKLALQMAFLRRHPDHVLAASDFSAFDDEDGYFDRSHARTYYAAIDRAGGLARIFPRRSTLRTEGLAPGVPLPPEVHVYHGEAFGALVGGNCLHPPTVVFRRDVAARAGLLHKRFGRDSDYEYLLRLSRLGPVAYVDYPLMRYRYSPDQMSSDRFLTEIAAARVTVLDMLKGRDPHLLRRRDFRRRLGYSHLAVAHTLSDRDRRAAAGHLVRSLAWGYVDGYTAKTIAKIVLPRSVVERVRRRRR